MLVPDGVTPAPSVPALASGSGEAALWPSPWPAEDGGPRRVQAPHRLRGLGVEPGERLHLAALRDAFATTMVVLRDPGEVFVLRHSLGRRPRADPSSSWVERIDPRTLVPEAESPRLPGGPFWPGGLAAHANGSLHLVHGRHCHRLSPELELLASRELPRPRPYNSFVVLGDGTLATKDIGLDLRDPAHLMLLDPETLEPRAEEVELPEPVVARLAADGDMLYLVGATTVWRYHWDGARLERDSSWQHRYHGGVRHSYGWDPVIAGGHVWLLDNGQHDYATTMRGAGRAPGTVRLHRVSCRDCTDTDAVEVSGRPYGAVTNPPLYDARRRIVIAYDSAQGVVQAFRHRVGLEPLWRRQLSHAAHMIHFPDTGELVMHDYHGPALARTRSSRALAPHLSLLMRSRAVRAGLARGCSDDVVILDIESGAERARASVPTMFQSVLFPAPGFARDLYWCTLSTLARFEVG
ncbi:MAG TPA: hypothetical protein VII87_13165 [Solirubrobacteraceae bacterium]